MARNRTRAERRAAKQRKPAIIIAATDNSRLNIRSALGLQLLRLWMYDPRQTQTRLQVMKKRYEFRVVANRDDYAGGYY